MREEDLLERLRATEARLARVEAERDAAVDDLELTRRETSQKIIYTLGHTRWAFDKRDHSRLQDVLDWLFEYQALGTIEKLSALVKAQDEGRVVVLDMPRKPLVWGDDEHDTCLCPDCGEDLMGIPYGEFMVLQCPTCGQYLDTAKAITRAEAEAALGGGGDG